MARIEELERRLRKLEEEKAAPSKEEPEGLFTLGGAELFFEGKAEFFFLDTENESDPVLGETDEPDPHFEVERLRLEPRLDVGRGLLLRAQIDFKPEDAQTILKELVLNHDAEPFTWVSSDFRLGIQDRFYRPSRPLKNYPLVGNAFWRDETVSAIWRIGVGDEQVGPLSQRIDVAEPDIEPLPADAPKGSPKSATKKKKSKEKDGKKGSSPAASEPPEAPPEPVPHPSRLGRLDLYLSLSNGPQLNNNEVGFDRAGFNDIVQDDRNTADDLALRELGVGLGYRRASAARGELEVLGFYVNDELSDESLDFLRQELTVRDIATGVPLAGYGDSLSQLSERYGATIEYHLPAAAIWGASDSMKAKDGLRLQGQWIRARDGELQRTGWSVHAGYRYSFPAPLLFGRYFRNIEPIVSYADLRSNLTSSPLLPGTWDRRQVLLGCLIDITGNTTLDIEYSFQLEKTGGESQGVPGEVSNNELLVELVVTF